MKKEYSKILIVVLFALIFIFTGLFLSIKSTSRPSSIFTQPHRNYVSTTHDAKPITINIIPSISSTPSGRTKAKVLRVIDGDTLELTDKRRVRYIGINTPESVDPRRPVQCFGKEASAFNKQLVEEQTIEMEKDVSDIDKYGRLLRYVYVDDVFINEFLVRQGYASIDTIPPDVKYAQTFLQAQKEAREAKRGLWGKCRNS